MGLTKTYLLAYNGALAFAWARVLVLASLALRDGGHRAVYDAVASPLLVAQTAAVMEILHAMTGIARSPVLVTAMQVSSRLMVVWGVLHVAPPSRVATYVTPIALPFLGGGGARVVIGVYSLMFAWGVTEVIRYGFYFLKLVDALETPIGRFVNWARYTFFLALYPLGVASELWLAWSAAAYVKKRGVLSYPMPNPWNVWIDWPSVTAMFFAGYVPGFPMLFGYMLKQRKKVLSPAGKKTKTA
jgi:very-long-chain (3R)-3-hydroxyacyl-CoA dehydratase|tara:strand:- start:962 stop:1690 length:729 start_codon:yes stop_codon:yes gene_type:complete|mmetsp:Transcript_6675/g.24580  ORF Transcript_6675/g.24580 Transcript_6675/m.24580 type:complete len:243 (+) Transcript_6675:1914-2642(+)